MKLYKSTAIICFIFFYITGIGQDYRIINRNYTTTFKYNSWGGRVNYNFIRIDSAIIIGSDTIHYNFHTINEFPGGMCRPIYDTNYLAHISIAKSNGDWFLFNRYGDSIYFKNNISTGSTWKLFLFPNGNYIEAEFSLLTYDTILNTPDSIRTIIFQLKDSAGNNLSHSINGDYVKIGKNSGLIRIFETFEFPTTLKYFDLAGNDNPIQGVINLTENEIYDFEVGDEFHYYGEGTGSMGSGNNNYRRKIILSKQISSTTDTITYTIDYVIKSITGDASGVTTYIFYDTITQTIILNDTSGENSLTNEPSFSFSDFSGDGTICIPQQFHSTDYNSRMQKSFYEKYWHDTFSDCANEIIGWCITPTKYFASGLGMTGESNGSPCPEYYLVYYKKGTETWGTPLNWSALLGTNDLIVKNELSMFPNPTSDYILLNTEKPLSVSVFDSFGKLVLQSSGTKQIDVSVLSNGIYFLRIPGYESMKFVKE